MSSSMILAKTQMGTGQALNPAEDRLSLSAAIMLEKTLPGLTLTQPGFPYLEKINFQRKGET